MKILVVEDEALVALQVESFLTGAGHEVVGIADSIASAEPLAAAAVPDLALVDVNLADGDSGIELAARLRERGIAVLLATGNCPPDLTDAIAIGCLGKPYGRDDVLLAVEVARAAADGKPLPPVPQALKLF